MRRPLSQRLVQGPHCGQGIRFVQYSNSRGRSVVVRKVFHRYGGIGGIIQNASNFTVIIFSHVALLPTLTDGVSALGG
jgi:hypothetical protein